MVCPYDKIENPDAWTAWQCVTQTGANVFLSGKAGTGKTTFLKQLKQAAPKRMVVAAPTGVAAINAGGVTLHSLFQLPFAPFVYGSKMKDGVEIRREKLRLIRTLDLLVIDEISMVRADLLDAIDAVLRATRRSQKPFGGVQLLLIGDLQQLPPVVTDADYQLLQEHYNTFYFFGSKALAQTTYVGIELKKFYRQRDRMFISLLEKVRLGISDADTLATLNSRYKPDFDPPERKGYIHLTTHNSFADQQNERKLNALQGKARAYECRVEGEFPENSYPAAKTLLLKEGAQVMFLKNDMAQEKRYFNGKIGHVVKLDDDAVTVRCTDDNIEVEISYEEWTNAHFVVDKSTNEITEHVDGVFRQIPLRLAWAITIHKSQGLTFDHAIIDAQAAFAHGQTYVALSRCRTFEGMVLCSQLTPSAFVTDQQVRRFIEDSSSKAIDEQKIEALKAEYAYHILTEMFDFLSVNALCHRILRIFEENLYQTYPTIITTFKALLAAASNEILSVADRFMNVCNVARIKGDLRTNPDLLKRIASGAGYFMQKISGTYEQIEKQSDVSIDNKSVAENLAEQRKQLVQELAVIRATLGVVAHDGFDVENYQKAKTDAILSGDKKTVLSPKAESTRSISVPAGVHHPELYQALVRWRAIESTNADSEEFMILPNKALMNICNLLPNSSKVLLSVPGFGKQKLLSYGTEILKIVQIYAEKHKIDLEAVDRSKVYIAIDAVKKKSKEIKTEKKEPKPKKPREPKESTLDITLRLFSQGLGPEKIAAERGLAESTIWAHLGDLAGANRIDAKQIVGQQLYDEIAAFVRSQQFNSLTDLYAACSQKYSYHLLRMVIKGEKIDKTEKE